MPEHATDFASVINQILKAQTKPRLFEPGKPRFWDDPHISKQLLAVHLNSEAEAASRPAAIIERSVNWIVEAAELHTGDALLDLGCGPGLYSTRFARKGLHVTGVDFSKRSIAYAREQAAKDELDITYEYADYLTMEYHNQFDVVCLIYGEFCVFNDAERTELLKRVKRALKPGGRFVFDVSTRKHRHRYGLNEQTWSAADSGFWRAEPHVVLKAGFDYPSEMTHVDQFVVIEQDGTVTTYRCWFKDHTPQTISAVLEQNGFTVKGMWNDLCGTPLTDDTEWIGIVATVE